MRRVCAFTGHRDMYSYGFDRAELEETVENLILSGVNKFLCGMAVGFDMLCAETVLKFKRKYGVKLVACVPCANQSEKFSTASKIRYDEIIAQCDEVITLYPYYTKSCMLERDRYMIDNCDVVVCFLRKQSGGTYYTVNYAEKKEIEIIRL